jgi:hypothetical protein
MRVIIAYKSKYGATEKCARLLFFDRILVRGLCAGNKELSFLRRDAIPKKNRARIAPGAA